LEPTMDPTSVTINPTLATSSPTADTANPTAATPAPTAQTANPTANTDAPTFNPTSEPTTSDPTNMPSNEPTMEPTIDCTKNTQYGISIVLVVNNQTLVYDISVDDFGVATTNVVNRFIQDNNLGNSTSALSMDVYELTITLRIFACNYATQQILIGYFNNGLKQDVIDEIEKDLRLEAVIDPFTLDVDTIPSRSELDVDAITTLFNFTTTDISLIIDTDESNIDLTTLIISALILNLFCCGICIICIYCRGRKKKDQVNRQNMVVMVSQTDDKEKRSGIDSPRSLNSGTDIEPNTNPQMNNREVGNKDNYPRIPDNHGDDDDDDDIDDMFVPAEPTICGGDDL